VPEQFENEKYTTSGWTQEEWEREWRIEVGTAYACKKCGNVVMITKGGVGTLEPYCCEQLMQPIGKRQE
jgi:hypothetical protein